MKKLWQGNQWSLASFISKCESLSFRVPCVKGTPYPSPPCVKGGSKGGIVRVMDVYIAYRIMVYIYSE